MRVVNTNNAGSSSLHDWRRFKPNSCRALCGDQSILETKKPVRLNGLMVVKAGLEPARRLKHKILNLACLPIPPLDHG